MIKCQLIILAMSGCVGQLWAATRIDSLITALDRAIDNRVYFHEQKERRIADARRDVAEASTTSDIFLAMGRMVDEYQSYDCDSTMAVCERRMALANQSGDPDMIVHARLNIAHTYTVMGLYTEALAIVGGMDTSMLPEYLHGYFYHIMRTLYGLMGDSMVRVEDRNRYLQLTDVYRDSLLAMQEDGSVSQAVVCADRHNAHGEYVTAAKVLENFMASDNLSDHDRAVSAYTLSESYRHLGYYDKQKEQLLISAIGDMESGVREYISLRQLAIMLYQEGDVKHAYEYLRVCMQDAVECNARQRIIELNSIFPVVNEVYLDTIYNQQRHLRVAVWVVCLLVLLLVVALYMVYREIKKLRVAKNRVAKMNRQLAGVNEELKRANEQLVEANRAIDEHSHLKEEYIARYMDMCAIYIEKMDRLRRSLNKIARQGCIDDLKTFTRNLSILDDEIKAFYDNFDDTFLRLFPTFVEDFNALLMPEEQIVPKTQGKLNTELRIFALIRLGITDSVQIAQFLRYSITTIYNYRTRVRNKARGDRDQLEEQLMKIGRLLWNKE